MLLLEDKIEKIVKNICVSSQFGTDPECEWSEELTDMEITISELVNENIIVDCGMSKCAIIIPSCGRVIKIPFCGSWITNEYWDEEEKCYKYEEPYFEEFWLANDIKDEKGSSWDYCKNELLKYERAVAAGFGEFFAKTELYTIRKDTPIYLQEKVKVFSSCLKSDYKYTESAKSCYESNLDKIRYKLPVDWSCMAIDWYGEEKFLQFVEYIKNNNISDLHGSNIGFAENGRPVILDWAGWRD